LLSEIGRKSNGEIQTRLIDEFKVVPPNKLGLNDDRITTSQEIGGYSFGDPERRLGLSYINIFHAVSDYDGTLRLPSVRPSVRPSVDKNAIILSV
jgi:hypothetical protein